MNDNSLRVYDPESEDERAFQAPHRTRSLHRIGEMRQRHCVSLKTVARHIDTDLRSARADEQPNADLPLSRLYQWQQILGVPITQLLELSHCVQPEGENDKVNLMLRLARSIYQQTSDTAVKQLARELCDHLEQSSAQIRHLTAWEFNPAAKAETGSQPG